MKKGILLIALIGMSFTINAQEKIQTELGLKNDFIYKNGKIGIGTTNPDQGTSPDLSRKLLVNGGITLASGGKLSYDPNYYVHAYSEYNSSVSEARFLNYGYYGHRWDTRVGIGMVMLGNNGNVGIGTSSPGFKLHINSSDNQLMRFTSTNGTWLDFESTNASTGSRIWSIGHAGPSGNFGIALRDGVDDYRLIVDSNGNVGMGTTSPSGSISSNQKGLHILDDNVSYLSLESTAGSGKKYTMYSSTSGSLVFWDASSSKARGIIDINGNWGIGSTSPEEKLHVENGALQFYNVGPDLDNVDIIKIGESTVANEFSIQGMFQGVGETGNAIKFRSMWNDNLLTIKGNGQIGIGTFETGTHKLAVEGTIGAREIKVEASGWSDFVFEKGYTLRTLEEVEQHINDNGHLPEIPNENEVMESGINLGEMDAKLLQKIEELTLYMIQMNKDMTDLKAKNKKLEEQVSTLENK